MKVKIAYEITVDIKEFSEATWEEKDKIVDSIVDSMYTGVLKYTNYQPDKEAIVGWVDEEDPTFDEDLLKDES